MQNELVERVRDAIVDASGCDWDDVFAENLARAAIEAYDLAVGERVERLTKALSEIRDLSSDNYDSDRAWALAMQLRARCELHGWLEQRGVRI
jgi:hypothetical protein